MDLFQVICFLSNFSSATPPEFGRTLFDFFMVRRNIFESTENFGIRLLCSETLHKQMCAGISSGGKSKFFVEPNRGKIVFLHVQTD